MIHPATEMRVDPAYTRSPIDARTSIHPALTGSDVATISKKPLFVLPMT
jgi:hypothetical protein